MKGIYRGVHPLVLFGMLVFPLRVIAEENVSSLISDSHLKLTLKNVWMYLDSERDDNIGTQSAWAQGLHLDYASGYYHDALGFDASWYGVMKLYANKYFYGRNMLRDNNGQAEGFNKLGQYYAKARWENNRGYLHLYGGWKQLYKFGVISVTRSRAAPSSWQGVSAEAGLDSWRVRGALVNRFSDRNGPDLLRPTTLVRHQGIPYIITGDLRWQTAKGKALRYAVGESKDYLLRQTLDGNWQWSLSGQQQASLQAGAYHNRGLKRWEGVRYFTREAFHYYALLGYQLGQAGVGIGWSSTRASLEHGLGQFYWHMGSHTRGFVTSPVDGVAQKYNHDGEKMWYAYADYRFTPSLKAGLYGNYGSHTRYRSVALNEYEFGAYTSWKSEQIRGLSVFLGAGPSFTWKQDRAKKPKLTADGKNFYRANGFGSALRFEYQIPLF